MNVKRTGFNLILLLALAAQAARGIDNLKLDQKLDYQRLHRRPSDHRGRCAIGLPAGQNQLRDHLRRRLLQTKRQAQRTVDLYNKYRDHVHFVVVDLGLRRSPAQQELAQAILQRIYSPLGGFGRR